MKKKMKKERIDIILVERCLAESRSKAQRLVMAGQVRVNGEVVPKPSVTFPPDVTIEIDPGARYVSRGGEKLEYAIRESGIEISGKVCADVGASTGGFTDGLLQHGAEKVYAIDVGRGILHWKLRQRTDVIVMEGTNARYLERLPEQVDLITIDASFISLRVLLPVVRNWFPESGGETIMLIKPQFEAGKPEVDSGKGVIRDPEVHKDVIYKVLNDAELAGYGVNDLLRSPLRGPKGNVEFLASLTYPGQPKQDLQEIIEPLFNSASTTEA
jgi:23S rRNA (cytidine1920-2'-O)/16S rRNA (cytidine1409-2'-O)-methyltransferase